MIVRLIDNDLPGQSQQAELYLEPMGDKDRETCKRLFDDYEISGCGRNTKTHEFTHVRIPLEKK